jgi:hypothetical protein
MNLLPFSFAEILRLVAREEHRVDVLSASSLSGSGAPTTVGVGRAGPAFQAVFLTRGS